VGFGLTAEGSTPQGRCFVAKKPAGGKGDLEQLLERIARLEARIAQLEQENQAAAAVAADFGLAMPQAAHGTAALSTAPLQGAAAGSTRDAGPAPAAAPPATIPAEEISEEVLLVLSAAVAAFLGERAHVRQVRLLHSDAWAQQGRVSVMSSHRWAVHR
jgi:methylmalonyl-CoA carboxyltransferase 12S subunit